MKAIIRAENMTKKFGKVVANRNINLQIFPSEIHCLFGENGAGKSTLSECLYGFLRPDNGQIYIREKPVKFRSPSDAISHGVGMVHQHFVLVQRHTVLENIVLGTEKPGPGAPGPEEKVRSICELYGIEIDLHAEVGTLAVGQQQWVEILKALYLDAEFLILDEPTAVLTPQESRRLFVVMRAMTERGISILLISHKLVDVMKSDWVTVIRKGELVDTIKTEETSAEELTLLMVGESLGDAEKKPEIEPGENVLKVDRLSAKDDRGVNVLNNVSLNIRRHEILGIAGVAGNGQKELFEVLAGVRQPESGKIEYLGEDITALDATGIVENRIGHIPDDRFKEGLVSGLKIAENIIFGRQRAPEFYRNFMFRWKEIEKFASKKIDDFSVAATSARQDVGNLSGGNAQKVILAREFDQSDSLLMANQPTRGLDVGVISYVHKELLRKRSEGFAILLASEELEDLFALSDRIIVMFKGEIMGEVRPEDTDFEAIGLMMAGQTLETQEA